MAKNSKWCRAGWEPWGQFAARLDREGKLGAYLERLASLKKELGRGSGTVARLRAMDEFGYRWGGNVPGELGVGGSVRGRVGPEVVGTGIGVTSSVEGVERTAGDVGGAAVRRRAGGAGEADTSRSPSGGLVAGVWVDDQFVPGDEGDGGGKPAQHLPATESPAASSTDDCRCRLCGRTGSTLDEFTSPYTGLCADCSKVAVKDVVASSPAATIGAGPAVHPKLNRALDPYEKLTVAAMNRTCRPIEAVRWAMAHVKYPIELIGPNDPPSPEAVGHLFAVKECGGYTDILKGPYAKILANALEKGGDESMGGDEDVVELIEKFEKANEVTGAQ